MEAAEGLGRLGTQAALDPLTHSMSTPDRELREALSKVLADRGVPAIRELLATTTTTEGLLALVWSLGKTRDPAAIEILVELAKRPESTIRAAVDLRLKLMPYLYTQLWRAMREHVPVLRPTLFDFGDDPATWADNDEMMVGPDLLVHANAHHMAVAYEPAEAAVRRIAGQGGGGVVARRRLVLD